MRLDELENMTLFTFEDQPGVRFGLKGTILGRAGYWHWETKLLLFEPNCGGLDVTPLSLAQIWHDHTLLIAAQRTINGYRTLVESLRTQLDEAQGRSHDSRRYH